MNILLDSNFLFSLVVSRDQRHTQSRRLYETWTTEVIITTELVLTETAYLIQDRVSHASMVAFTRTIAASSMVLEPVYKPDLLRAADIMEKYREAEFDLADACLMALSERMKVTQFATYDYRDFGQFRPSHCDHLTLLPN